MSALEGSLSGLESLLGSLSLPDGAGEGFHRGGPLADEDGVDGAVVQDDVAGAAFAGEPHDCAFVSDAVVPVELRSGQLAGFAVAESAGNVVGGGLGGRQQSSSIQCAIGSSLSRGW